MTLPDAATVVHNFNGWHNDLVNSLADVEADLTTLTGWFTADAASLAGLVNGLLADGLPSGPFGLGGEGGQVVSVLQAPGPPLELVTEQAPLTVSLCLALVPVFTTLGENALAAVLTERAAGGPPLAGPLPNS